MDSVSYFKTKIMFKKAQIVKQRSRKCFKLF